MLAWEADYQVRRSIVVFKVPIRFCVGFQKPVLSDPEELFRSLTERFLLFYLRP